VGVSTEKKPDFRNGIEKLKELMDGLSKAGFYGELTVKFEAGKAVIVRKTETMKM